MISKVALLQYYAKSIPRDAEQWPEWTEDISLTVTHTLSIKVRYSKLLLGMLQFTNLYLGKVLKLVRSFFCWGVYVFLSWCNTELCKLQDDMCNHVLTILYTALFGIKKECDLCCIGQNLLIWQMCWFSSHSKLSYSQPLGHSPVTLYIS